MIVVYEKSQHYFIFHSFNTSNWSFSQKVSGGYITLAWNPYEEPIGSMNLIYAKGDSSRAISRFDGRNMSAKKGRGPGNVGRNSISNRSNVNV